MLPQIVLYRGPNYEPSALPQQAKIQDLVVPNAPPQGEFVEMANGIRCYVTGTSGESKAAVLVLHDVFGLQVKPNNTLQVG